ncbi:MAG: EamA family transporter [Theionarchaea archaeon]|nr:EamA family transporter [Theionarchaea archaeon]
MKAEIFALMTAILWGVGSFFEKKGLHLSGISPQVGILIRTGTAVILLAVISYPHWHQIREMEVTPLVYMVVGGGILAGTLGMLFFYKALSTGELSRVLPIAFTSPVYGAIMGIIILGEEASPSKIVGITLSFLGVAILTFF